jgi:glycine dehydrogenase subunit 1
MRPYIPHTEADTSEMLATIGAASIDELFREIPEDLRIRGPLDLPDALDEQRLAAHLFDLAGKNVNMAETTCFLGAGIYDRFIPSTVSAMISRGEFLTAYTPYQPEASQGYLQTIYEFQSMVAELYGMDVANASMYDGATSMAEAAIMASGLNGRSKIAVSDAIHPHYLQVLHTYCWSMGLSVDRIQPEAVTSEHACYIAQYPDFFGSITDLAPVRSATTAAGALMVVVADPIACALLPSPGSFGADVVVGEGQPMGIAMGLGGPVVGLFACKNELVRRIPGRIVGRTREVHGDKIGYVMTLRTREQDIRREKATSNICTNEALMALAATVYMSALGKNGMRQVAEGTVRNTQYAISEFKRVGLKVRNQGKVFGEFVLELPRAAAEVRDLLLDEQILAGLPLGAYYPGMDNCLLVAVTEIRTRAEIDRFVSAVRNCI